MHDKDFHYTEKRSSFLFVMSLAFFFFVPDDLLLKRKSPQLFDGHSRLFGKELEA